MLDMLNVEMSVESINIQFKHSPSQDSSISSSTGIGQCEEEMVLLCLS